MFLQKPISADVLREQVVRLLVAYGRLPRRLSAKLSAIGYDAYPGTSGRVRSVVN